MATDTLFDLTADLRALGGGRVWSLMVSLFGDLAQGQGDKIDGPVLSAIMAELGVRPEAARVALHRLRNDGWIASEKRGRISHHSLTAKGRTESAAASPRIYAGPDEGPAEWQLVLLERADPQLQETLTCAGMVQLLPRILIGTAPDPLPGNAVVLPGQAAPGWLCDQLIPSKLMQDYASLGRILMTLSDRLTQSAALSPIQTAVLRCLVVHNWRRLVLKHPAAPRGLIRNDSALYQCHLAVDAILSRYPRPALRDIALEPTVS